MCIGFSVLYHTIILLSTHDNGGGIVLDITACLNICVKRKCFLQTFNIWTRVCLSVHLNKYIYWIAFNIILPIAGILVILSLVINRTTFIIFVFCYSREPCFHLRFWARAIKLFIFSPSFVQLSLNAISMPNLSENFSNPSSNCKWCIRPKHHRTTSNASDLIENELKLSIFCGNKFL